MFTICTYSNATNELRSSACRSSARWGIDTASFGIKYRITELGCGAKNDDGFCCGASKYSVPSVRFEYQDVALPSRLERLTELDTTAHTRSGTRPGDDKWRIVCNPMMYLLVDQMYTVPQRIPIYLSTLNASTDAKIAHQAHKLGAGPKDDWWRTSDISS